MSNISKGQIAIEYLIIMGIVLFLSIPSIIIYQGQSESIRDEISLSQAHVSVQKIVDTAESIFYLGAPSKETIKVYFPDSIKSISVSTYEINIIVGEHNLYLVSKIPINGTILATPGIHEIEILAKTNGTTYIQITGK
ncbi:hypothetical protein JXM83_03555 [Candidatus Woesearchaeota archaeon]|nr:hypothetical protein [Candidatus Woesearchaeota archaeon]